MTWGLDKPARDEAEALPVDQNAEVVSLLLIRCRCPHIFLHEVEKSLPVDGGKGEGQHFGGGFYLSQEAWSVGVAPVPEARVRTGVASI
jgi:hypothetical protein